MRKTFNLLFICLIALYGWIGYQVIHTTDLPQCQPEGSLSDVAEEVIAIPLKTNGHCSLNKIKMIKRDREDIFLVSDRQLYHFNSSGQFLGQITAHLPGTRQPVELVDYAVDPVHDRLVVIGTGHEVYYYDYDGQLLFQSILPQDASWKTFGHMAYYNNHLWTTIDLVNSENKQAPSIEQWLYKFDLYFNEVGKRKLDVADLGRMDINYKTGTEIAVKDGHVYVQAPSLQPLKTNGHCSLNKIKMIKRDREDIFLVSDRQLYHFNSSGQFLGQITAHLPGTRQPVELVDYAVDPVHDRLVVIGTGHEVYYYDYDGQLLFQSILPQDASWKTFGHMAYYNNHLWTTIDLVNSENKQAPSIEQWLYKFDLYFNEVGKRKLDVADLGRMDINYKTGTEIAVKDGHVYVQAPSLQPAHILNDTLYLINSNQLTITEDYAKILPLQIGTRFLISTHYDPTLPERSYTFCYDQRRTKAYHVQGGLDDNFYKTGKILELQSIDLQSNTYCYYKSGKELAYSFPDLTNKDNPVLFIVKMKA